ncbi:YlbD family protein [Ornithinibacillus scapharcae]|uniref:YlbD family protein n=1 Tax=Ornithinibacillus scapharcae TaxID=1147159 RepID=UPI000225B8BF|nr:spore coat protein YlbD [Ornithinibacillus scapharcae]
MSSELHPTVRQFREFINQHPKLRKELRKTGRSWQEYYEKWLLLGEEDAFWDEYKDEHVGSESSNDQKNELLGQMMRYFENVDINKVQKQVHQLSGTIATVQELLDQFQGNKRGNPQQERPPFGWFRD